MKTKFIILLASLAVLASVHSADAPKSDSAALQGKWEGTDKTPGAPDGLCYLTITGNKLHFVGTDTNDWCKGTFTLNEDTHPKQFTGVIKDCPSSDCVGLTLCAIYSLEDGKFTVAGSPPGQTNFPASLDAPEARKIVFNRK